MRAVVRYGLRDSSSIEARVSRANAARYHQVSTQVGSSMCRPTSSAWARPRAEVPSVVMPWVGSQRRVLAKTMISRMPSQKGGVEYPIIESVPMA